MRHSASLRPLSILLLALPAAGALAQNLLRNPGFETVPNAATGQGLLPSEWYSASSTPDAYSNDGSYGLSPSDFNNFTGILAHGGSRWVAGANFGPESIGQVLTAPLVAGAAYTATAFLHQAVRSDLNNPGGYLVRLQNADGTLAFDAGILGYTISVAAGWTANSLTFAAPANAALLTRFVYVPVSAPGAASSYAGLDDVTLQAVPEPASFAALGLGALATLRRRRA